MPNTVAFFSYAHSANEASDGRLAEVHRKLDLIVRDALRGNSVFRDEDRLQIGYSIGNSIKEALDTTLVFIPIITSSYFDSSPCMAEFRYFFKLYENEGKHRRILPIIWDGRSLENPESDCVNECSFIEGILYSNWDEFRVSEKDSWIGGQFSPERLYLPLALTCFR